MDAIRQASALLRHYGFDLSGKTSEQIVNQWLQHYEANWIFLAIFEALYQGRYKAVSVSQILVFWQRRGEPIYHFNSDFEYLICHRLPQNLLAKKSQSSLNINSQEEVNNQPLISIELSSLKHPNFYSKLKSFMEESEVDSSPAETITVEESTTEIESSIEPVEFPVIVNEVESSEEPIPPASELLESETIEPIEEVKPSVIRRDNKPEFEPPQSASA